MKTFCSYVFLYLFLCILLLVEHYLGARLISMTSFATMAWDLTEEWQIIPTFCHFLDYLVDITCKRNYMISAAAFSLFIHEANVPGLSMWNKYVNS